MKLNKINFDKIYYFLLVFGFLLILLVGYFTISYYFATQKDECMSQPFVYGSKEIEKMGHGDFIGSGFILLKDGKVLPSLNFNSTSQSWTLPS